MNSPSHDIATYLDVQGAGTLGTNLFIDTLPISPNDAVVVANRSGREPLAGLDVYRPSIQIIVRGDPKTPATAYNKAEQIRDLLHNVGNVEMDDSSGGEGCRYILIQIQGDIQNLPVDENNRSLLLMNFRIMRTPLD